MTHSLYVRTIDGDGREFPSMRACSRAHNVNRRTVERHLDKYGNLDRLGKILSAHPGNQFAAKQVVIWKFTWPSRVAAAKDLGVSPTTIGRWLKPSATGEMRQRLLLAVMQWQARTTQKRRAA